MIHRRFALRRWYPGGRLAKNRRKAGRSLRGGAARRIDDLGLTEARSRWSSASCRGRTSPLRCRAVASGHGPWGARVINS